MTETLLARSRLILLRTQGLMRHANDYVQHFNPACRVARMFPAWHVSRLLFSVNDHDLPLRFAPYGPMAGRVSSYLVSRTRGSSSPRKSGAKNAQVASSPTKGSLGSGTVVYGTSQRSVQPPSLSITTPVYSFLYLVVYCFHDVFHERLLVDLLWRSMLLRLHAAWLNLLKYLVFCPIALVADLSLQLFCQMLVYGLIASLYRLYVFLPVALYAVLGFAVLMFLLHELAERRLAWRRAKREEQIQNERIFSEALGDFSQGDELEQAVALSKTQKSEVGRQGEGRRKEPSFTSGSPYSSLESPSKLRSFAEAQIVASMELMSLDEFVDDDNDFTKNLPLHPMEEVVEDGIALLSHSLYSSLSPHDASVVSLDESASSGYSKSHVSRHMRQMALVSGPPLSSSNARVFGHPQAATLSSPTPTKHSKQSLPHHFFIFDEEEKSIIDSSPSPQTKSVRGTLLVQQRLNPQPGPTLFEQRSLQKQGSVSSRPPSSSMCRRVKRMQAMHDDMSENSFLSSRIGSRFEGVQALPAHMSFSQVVSHATDTSQYTYKKYAGRMRRRMSRKLDGRSGDGPGSNSHTLLQEGRDRTEKNVALLTLHPRATLPSLDLYSGANRLFNPHSDLQGAVEIRMRTRHVMNPSATSSIVGPGSILNAEHKDDGERLAHPMFV
ncbi:hypothetical protein EON65_09430 [archaeon]|nr:MAG: hypothetical protein EON65_09430 [archaeon]